MRLDIMAVLVLNMVGCSIYKAATAPPPVAVDRVTVGTSRAEVMSVFGSPKNTDSAISGKTDIYEFIDGNNGASKLRILPYIAADVFTLGLAELVLWPLELSVLQGSEGRAVVTFDADNVAKVVKVTEKNGSPWAQE
jgi:hypothetical protein